MRENTTYKNNFTFYGLNPELRTLFTDQHSLIDRFARQTFSEPDRSTAKASISDGNEEYSLWIGRKESKKSPSLLASMPDASMSIETTTYHIKANQLANVLSGGMNAAALHNKEIILRNLDKPNQHTREFLELLHHSLLQTGIVSELDLKTYQTNILGEADISDQLLDEIIKKATEMPDAIITLANTACILTPNPVKPDMSSIDLLLAFMSLNSIPQLRLHSRFSLYFGDTPVLMSTSRALIQDDGQRKVAQDFQQHLLTTFAEKSHTATDTNARDFHLSYLYWWLRTSFDEPSLHDTPLCDKTLNNALKTANLAQNAGLDPANFFIDAMYLEELPFIKKHRDSVKIDQHNPSLLESLRNFRFADYLNTGTIQAAWDFVTKSLSVSPVESSRDDQHAEAKYTKKVKVKCPQELKGLTARAVADRLRSFASDPLKQTKLAQEFCDYAKYRSFPKCHMNKIKKMAGRVNIIPGKPEQPSRLFVVRTEKPSDMKKVEKSIKAHFGAEKT